MKQQKIDERERNFVEEKKCRDAFIGIMAQVLNKYGRNVLNKSEQTGGNESE